MFWQQIVCQNVLCCVFHCEFAQFFVGRRAASWNKLIGDGILDLKVVMVCCYWISLAYTNSP